MGPRRLPDLDGVELRLAEVSRTEAERPALHELLSDDERARFERFKVEGARLSFLVSRGFLRTMLGQALGCEPGSLSFGEGPHGKPFLMGPHADSGIEFNVSHSGDLVLYAVSRGRTLGVDVEWKKQDRELEKLARRFFAPGEARRLLEDATPAERLDSFYRCWTRKEAYLKAKGTGLTTRLSSFEVTFLPGVAPAMLHTEVPGEDPSDWKVFAVGVPEGYEAALVVHR
jgi:4'-phosphopantetheinyl transferase